MSLMIISKSQGLQGQEETQIRYGFEEGNSPSVRCKKMKLEFLVNRTLQVSLGERRTCNPPPMASPIAWSGLHQEYENGSGKKNEKG